MEDYKSNGYLVISLDFELLWGVFDKVNHIEKGDYFINTIKLIPSILRLFEKFEISCTWATVGMLMNENWDEWKDNIPSVLPNYQNTLLSPYVFGKNIMSRKNERMCFAPDLVERIKNTPKQELASHTYSHYYCLEPGQNKESFEADLISARKLAQKFGTELKSLVFPRNQFNERYLKACSKNGIYNLRCNPDNWYWNNTQKDRLTDKIWRTADAYFGKRDKSYSGNLKNDDLGIFKHKASRLLRPYSKYQLLNRLKLKRISSEMEKAAKNNQVYHLWWHPHNFGNSPEKNLMELESILRVYKNLNFKYNFFSVGMNELGNKIQN